MASIRKCASKVIDTARYSEDWFVLWKTGRSWHLAEELAYDYDYATKTAKIDTLEDGQEIELILTEDPRAVILKSRCFDLGDTECMTVNGLVDALLWQYENGDNFLCTWTFKCETEQEESDSQVDREKEKDMKIAEKFDQFVERVSEAERTVLNSPIGQELTTELLKKKLAQNPNMTQEEWAQTESEFMTFLFAMFVKETLEAMKELGGHVWNEMQAVP